MKKYDSYKDSGIEWIGEIPSHWEEYRLGVIGRFSSSGIDKKIIEDEPHVMIINYTDVYGNKEMILNSKKEYMVVTTPQSKIEQHSVKKGDLIFTPSSETKEDIGLSAVVVDDLENTAFSYHVLRFQFNQVVDLQFKKYLCNNNIVLNYFSKNSKGTTRQILGREDFKNAKVVIPPLDEQTAIANFLDRKTSEIDEIIADKKRLLELYEEEKTAIINKAVTKGINPDAPMKDSGIEWLGEIPEHWEVKKIKHLLKKKKGALKTGPFGSQLKNSDLDSSGEYKVYTQRNVLDNDFIEGDDKINEVKFQSLKEFLIEDGDILFTSRGTIGVCNVFPADSEPGILHPCLIRIQIDRDRVHQDWIINYVNNSSLFIDNVKYESNATTIEVIYGGTLKETALPVPPIKEQQSIVQHIEAECSRIDFKKARTEELIELLTEYRTALISEAVTGKIKIIED